MRRSFSWFVSRRYFRVRRKASAVGVITTVAAFGVTISVFAMFVVLSVFSGLRSLNTDYAQGLEPDVSIRPRSGKVFSADTTLMRRIASVPGVAAAAQVLEEKVFVSCGYNETVARLKGISLAYNRVVAADTTLVGGSWFPPSEQSDTVWSVIGITLAYRLGMNDAEIPLPVRLYVPSGQDDISLSPEALFSSIETWPRGAFSYKDYDDSYLFTTIGNARKLLRRSDTQVSAVEVKAAPGHTPDQVASSLENILPEKDFVVKTAAQNQEAYYKIMNTENLVLYFIFALVIAIALFNVIGSVVMLILDKRENIHTLWALGADKRTLENIFVSEGMMIVGAGAAVGLLLAVALVWAQLRFHLFMIEGGMQIPYPVALTWPNAALVILTISALGYAAARLSVAGMKNFFRHKS